MSQSLEQIENLNKAIAALEAQRTILGDAVVETSIAALRRQLAELEPPLAEQQRKQVTVLFADVSGFTAMSETLDAEEVTEVMNALWARLDGAIAAHGGVIDKHMGDAVMAVWGAGGLGEDDPERAIRAALAMQQEIKKGYRESLFPLSIALRIGINTGPVLLGAVGSTHEFTAMGDAVNTASRLQNAAPVGGILITHGTYRQVRGLFDVLPQDPLVLKGKAEPIQTYIVQRAKPHAFRMLTRGVEGIETRMVGRLVELLALQDAFRAAMSKSETRLVTIVGDAGVGKSRLLYEFNNWIELLPDQIYYFKGRATPAAQTIPYSLIRDLFAYRFDIRETDQATTALEKFRAGVAGILDPDQADLVGHMVGFDFSASLAVRSLLGSPTFRQLATSYLARYVHAMAEQPTVIFLEDLHWADVGSLELVNYLVNEIPQARLLVVCLARPAFFERQPGWGNALRKDLYTQIDLKPLSASESAALVNQILCKVDRVPTELQNLIVSGAEGNPFYLEELVKMFIENGVIVREVEQWRVALDRLASVRVPPTLTGILQARLDSLPREEKAVLQRASVVGRLFWNGTVAELAADATDEMDQVRMDALLDAIRRRELVFRHDRSVFEGTDEYIFKHALLRDVVYETVLLKLRRVYHAQVARWLEAHAGERLGEYLELIAGHYEQAGEKALAAKYLGQSGGESVNVGAYRDAIAAFERALALVPSPAEGAPEEKGRLALLSELGTTYSLIGNYTAAVQYLELGLALARARDDKDNVTNILFALSDIAYRRGEDELVTRYAQEGLAICRERGDRAGIARGLDGLGKAVTVRQDYVEAKRYFEESLAIYRELGDRPGEGGRLTNLGETARKLGHYEEAAQYHEQALLVSKEAGNRYTIAICLNNLGNVQARLGQTTVAQGYLFEALKESVAIGAFPLALETLVGIALLYLNSNRHSPAAELLGLILNHPMLNAEVRQFADPILATLRQALAADQLEAALARGRARTLEEVVKEILADLPPASLAMQSVA